MVTARPCSRQRGPITSRTGDDRISSDVCRQVLPADVAHDVSTILEGVDLE